MVNAGIKQEADVLLEAVPDDEEWIGVDLDGTLAKYNGWKGATKIGDPVPKMAARVRRWVGHGKKVKIFTARADDERTVNAIKKWLKDNELPDLEVTNLKDHHMKEFWDDRAVAVKKNTGEVKEAAQSPVIETMKRIVDAWAQEDWDWVCDGCADVTAALWRVGKRLGWHVTPVTGNATTRNGETFAHAWLLVDGKIFDPVAYANRYKVLKYDASEGTEEQHVKTLRDFFGVETDEDDPYVPDTGDLIKNLGLGPDEMKEDAARIVEYLLLESPEFKTLEKNQVKLEPEERERAMKAGAVWHFSDQDKPSCAIKKAVVKGKTWYWCNTHRCGQVRPTLKGAISAFDFVKTTA